jgi:hypothetical protein
MAKDIGEVIGTVLGRTAREAAEMLATNARKGRKNGSASAAKGFAVGAGLVALAPLAVKGAGKVAKSANLDGAFGSLVEKAGGGAKRSSSGGRTRSSSSSSRSGSSRKKSAARS